MYNPITRLHPDQTHYWNFWWGNLRLAHRHNTLVLSAWLMTIHRLADGVSTLPHWGCSGGLEQYAEWQKCFGDHHYPSFPKLVETESLSLLTSISTTRSPTLVGSAGRSTPQNQFHIQYNKAYSIPAGIGWTSSSRAAVCGTFILSASMSVTFNKLAYCLLRHDIVLVNKSLF